MLSLPQLSAIQIKIIVSSKHQRMQMFKLESAKNLVSIKNFIYNSVSTNVILLNTVLGIPNQQQHIGD